MMGKIIMWIEKKLNQTLQCKINLPDINTGISGAKKIQPNAQPFKYN